MRGNLNYLMKALSRNYRATELVDRIQPVFQLYEQAYISERSLWYRKRPGKRTKAAPVIVEDTTMDSGMAEQARQLLQTEYDRAAIAAYIENWLGESGICFSKDIHLVDDKSYIMSLLTVLISGERSAQHTVKELEGTFSENGYTIPQLRIMRKEGKK